jgi:O-antigen/teichoic acid export membrane protein
LALGVFRFYHKSDDEEDRRGVVSTSFLLVGGMYVVVGTGVFLGAGALSQLIFGSDAHTLVIRIAAGNLAASALTIVPMSFARVRDLSVFFVGVGIVKLVLALGFNILFVVGLRMGVTGVFLSSLLANLLVGSYLAQWLIGKVGIAPSRRWTRDLLRYGVPLMATQVATFIATFSDRYFLQAIGDEAVVGLYSLAYQFGFLLVMVGFSPMDMVWGPKRFEVARGEDGHQALARGFLIMNLLLLTTGVGIVLYVEDVLRIMAAPAFHSAYRVVPVILVAYVLQCWASVQDIGVLVRERTQYITLANFVSAGVALVGYAILIPPFMEWGAAVATVLAFFTRYILTYVFSQRLWPVRYRWRPVWVLVSWAVLLSAISLALPRTGLVISITVNTGLLGVYIVGLWVLPIMDEEERQAVKGLATAGLSRLGGSRRDGAGEP